MCCKHFWILKKNDIENLKELEIAHTILSEMNVFANNFLWYFVP